MIIKSLKLQDIKIIKPDIFKDKRGYFFESYNQIEFENAIGRKIKFVQDNQSFSNKNVLRGLHFQLKPFGQGKLIRVISGEIFDVAVDLRKSSKTFGFWVSHILKGNDHKFLWIPEGFAHGFYCLKDSLVQYKTTSFYSKKHSNVIRWDDPNLAINWPIKNAPPIISNIDKKANIFRESFEYFR